MSRMDITTNKNIKTEVIHQIIDTIRFNAINDDEEEEWNEMEEGARWLDNEVYFACSLMHENEFTESLSNAKSVDAFRKALFDLRIETLNFIRFIVVDMKGTKNDDLFELRELLEKCK